MATPKSRGKKAAELKTPTGATAHQTFDVPLGLMHQTLSAARSSLPEDFHALYDRGFRAARGIVPAASPQETAGHRRLLADVPDLKVEYDQATQLPNFVVCQQRAERLSRRAANSPAQAVTDFIQDRSDLWNLSPEDVATVEVVSVSQTGLHTVNLIQRVEGKEVFNSDLTAAVSPNNEVLSLAGQIFPAAAAANTRAAAAAATSEEAAIAQAAFDLTGIVYPAAGDFSPLEAQGDSAPYRFYQYTPPEHDPRPPFEASSQAQGRDVPAR